MAREISAGRFSQLARALFDLGESRPLQLDDNIRAVVLLEGDRPEYSFAKGERLWHSNGISQPAVAAEIAFSGFVMPVDTKSLAVVKFIQNTSSGQAVDLIVGQVLGTGLITGELQRSPVSQVTDSRWGPGAGTSNCALRAVRASSAGGVGFATGRSLLAFVAATLPATLTDPAFRVVLGPGGFVGVQGQAVNVAASLQAHGYERVLQQGVRA